jgi:hypothetical protein
MRHILLVQSTDRTAERSLAVRPGDVIELVVSEIPSAGYRWQRQDDTANIDLVSDEYLDADRHAHLPESERPIGGPLARRLTYTIGTASLPATLTVACVRSWIGYVPGEDRSLTVQINAR